MTALRIRKKILLLSYFIISSFLLLELIIRIYLGFFAPIADFKKYASHEQLRKAAQQEHSLRLIPSGYLPWIPAPNFRRGEDRHNSLGFRGEELPLMRPLDEIWIACLGGSTTYDDNIETWSEAYPAKLEAILREKGYNVRVINAGIPLASSYESLIFYALRVSYLKPDLVISLDVANDVAMRLVWPPEAYAPDNSGIVGSTLDTPQERLYEKSAFLRFVLTEAGLRLSSEHRYLFIPAPTCLVTKPWDDENGMATLAGSSPKLTMRQVLDANPPTNFERNLRHMAALVKNDQANILFCTCPTSQPAPGELTSAENEVLVEIRAMNNRLKEIASDLSVSVIDLAEHMPGDKNLWADSIHNTAEGAALKANLIASFLIEGSLLVRHKSGVSHRANDN